MTRTTVIRSERGMALPVALFALVVIGALVLALARPRWRSVTAAMRRGEPLPAYRFGALLSAALLAVMAGAAAIVLLV